MNQEELLTKLLEYGFITGSQAFGTADENSDWDFCFPIFYSAEIYNILDEFSWDSEDSSLYFNGTKYSQKTKKIGENGYFIANQLNAIPVHYHSFKSWYLTTQIVPTVYRNVSMTKIQKHGIFESFMSQINGYSSELGGIEQYRKEIADIIKNENNDIKAQILHLKFIRTFEKVQLKSSAQSDLPF